MTEVVAVRPPRRKRFVVGGVIVAVGALALIVGQMVSDAEVVTGAGTLTVGGVVYHFTPTTCLISDEDFVATGHGLDDGEQFWVSASSVGLDLAVGTESEIEEPADDQLWLISDDAPEWTADGNTVTARAPMADRRSPQSTTVVGSLELRCDADV